MNPNIITLSILTILILLTPAIVWGEVSAELVVDDNGNEYWEGPCNPPECEPMPINGSASVGTVTGEDSSDIQDGSSIPESAPPTGSAAIPGVTEGVGDIINITRGEEPTGSAAIPDATEDNNAHSGGVYKANVELNYQSDCWTSTTVVVNDGEFGKQLASKSVSIDPASDEANDLWKNLVLEFKQPQNDIQVLVTVYDSGQFVESVYAVQDKAKTTNFEFNGLVPC